MNRKILALIAVILIVVIIGGYYIYRATHREYIVIFCAGSLKIPLERLAKIYTDRYGIEVRIEASGSVRAIRKVIDVGSVCDVLAVADCRLLKTYMYPNYASWYAAFATNKLVLAYTSKSKYSDILDKHPDRWIDILLKNDVRYGFSNPNEDPCGYRAVGVLALASIYYHDTTIFERLVVSKTNITYKYGNDSIEVYIPADLEVSEGSNLIVRSKSVDLISLLEAGSLDYAFEYKSVAIQHGLKYVELPPEINLGLKEYDDFYSKVVVKILVGSKRMRSIIMKSIIYGVTIPKCARNYSGAIKFIKLLLSEVGRKIFKECGQDFLNKVIYYGSIPNELRI